MFIKMTITKNLIEEWALLRKDQHWFLQEEILSYQPIRYHCEGINHVDKKNPWEIIYLDFFKKW